MSTKKTYSIKPSPRTPESLRNILDNEIMKAIPDYSQPIDPYIDKILKRWQADLENRTPAPIYTEGPDGYPLYSGTDIDLFGFTMGLAARKAIINLPDYKRRTPTALRSDEWRLTPSPHGQVFSVVSNEDAHSFSIRIKDFGVMKKNPDGSEELGRPRNLMLVDYSGRLYKGASQFQFAATKEERDFLKRYGLPYEESEKLFRGEAFTFKHFVFPTLWSVFYTPDYLLAKALAQRCKIEGNLHRQRAKYLQEDGVRLPVTELPPPVEYERPQEKVEKIKVNNLTARLLLPEEELKNHKALPVISMDRYGEIKKHDKWPTNKEEMQGILKYSKKRANNMSWGMGARVRAIPRAVEYAMLLYGFKKERVAGNELLPNWADGWQPWKRGSSAMAIADNLILSYRIGEHTITQKEQELEGVRGILLEDMKKI